MVVQQRTFLSPFNVDHLPGREGGGATFFRVQVHVYQRAGAGASLQKLKGMQILKLQCRYVKGVPIVYRRYSKEALFLLKMV